MDRKHLVKEILHNSIRRIERNDGFEGDELKRSKAVKYALQNMERWGIPDKLILSEGKSMNLDVEPFIGIGTIAEWLEDEALTPEEFYNDCWDFAEIVPSDLRVSSLQEIREWMSGAEAGQEKTFITGRDSSSSDSLEIKCIEFEGAVGFEYRRAVGGHGPGDWCAGSFSNTLEDLREHIS